MKTYEQESFLKTFSIFLILLEVLLAINFIYEYRVKEIDIKEKIQMEMKLCAYTVQCDGLHTDFIAKNKHLEENVLLEDKDFYSYFSVPTVKKYLMKVVYPKKRYLERLEKVKEALLKKFLLYSFFAALVSILFAMYALMPLRRALYLNEEFVKDILHDFNTPLSSMMINLKLLKKELGENVKIHRMENNIETILSLQYNLRAFLKGMQTQIETFDLQPLIKERMNYFRVLYPDIAYKAEVSSFLVHTNKDAFTRVLDNILSNAGKYNRSEGKVTVSLKSGGELRVEDTGKGISNPSRIFDRYYKEQDRGIGIGLHIVKKLCDEMHIRIKIKSRVGEGTVVSLFLSKIAA